MSLFYTDTSAFPVGALTIVADEEAVLLLYNHEYIIPRGSIRRETALLCQTLDQLTEYFSGTRRSFDLPLAPAGSAFQKKVWNALLDIPYGETRSYKQIAQAVGNPQAYRAVGMANHRNPIMILIPCHRVIGADGSLTGYGGGLEAKLALLTLEKYSQG